MEMTEHVVLDTGQVEWTALGRSCTLSQPEERGHRRPHGLVQEQSKQPGTVGGRLCSTKRGKWPLALLEDVISLFE